MCEGMIWFYIICAWRIAARVCMCMCVWVCMCVCMCVCVCGGWGGVKAKVTVEGMGQDT